MEKNVIKTLGKAFRGLTFSLSEKFAVPGEHYRYIVDNSSKCIRIIKDAHGAMTVSRKKSGKGFKPLFDIRAKEVKNLVQEADYMEIELLSDCILVHCLKKAEENSILLAEIIEGRFVDLNDILAKETGVIRLAAGGENVKSFYPYSSSLKNDAYFDYLVQNAPVYVRQNKKIRKDIRKVYDVVSLFSGAGLLDLSFKNDPRTRIVYAVDFDKDACETYKANIGPVIECTDIRTVDENHVPSCDIVIGGPCCQGYSNSNRHDIEKDSARKKRLLIDDYIRITKAKQPKAFVIENVPQLLTKEDGLYIKKVFDGLSEYEITTAIIEDDKVGGYSTRKRCIVIGSKVGKIALPSVKLVTTNSVRDALKNVDSTWFNWNDVTVPRESSLEVMKCVKQGQNWHDTPKSLWLKHGWTEGKTQSNIFRRLSWDKPSVTITNWRKSCLTHPSENRILNVSEAAAIMGLPKEFHILGSSLNSRQQQIGNGVTQAVARLVKNTVLSALEKATVLNIAV